MKKIEPTKNVTPIAGRELEAHCEARAATGKHSDPSANSTLIHQPRRRGRHHTGSVPSLAPAPVGDPALAEAPTGGPAPRLR